MPVASAQFVDASALAGSAEAAVGASFVAVDPSALARDRRPSVDGSSASVASGGTEGTDDETKDDAIPPAVLDGEVAEPEGGDLAEDVAEVTEALA